MHAAGNVRVYQPLCIFAREGLRVAQLHQSVPFFSVCLVHPGLTFAPVSVISKVQFPSLE